MPLWLELFLFGATVLMAWRFGWQARDLVWSLWLSSLVVGYAIIVTQLYKRFTRRVAGGRHPFAALGSSLLTLAFFSLHFGIFHYVQGMFLNSFSPLVDESLWPSGVFPVLFRDYWPFLIAAFALRWPQLNIRHQPRRFGPGYAYKNVIRMHFLIFALAAVKSVTVPPLLLYALVYAVFFLPLERLVRRRRR